MWRVVHANVAGEGLQNQKLRRDMNWSDLEEVVDEARGRRLML